MFNPVAKRTIPALMATQHPDNARAPSWSASPFITAQQEIDDLYHSFEDLLCDEYMWDWEGKFADEAMIERLYNRYLETFQKKQVGRDVFVTMRIPNIWEEKTFKLARAYMTVLSSGEFAKSLKVQTPPVFEMILPMTRRADQLSYIQETFKKTAQVHEAIFDETRFGKGYIQVIPIFESIDDLLVCDKLIEDFISLHKTAWKEKPAYMRVFIARSDPALNAGFVPAVLASRIALSNLTRVTDRTGVPIHPIIGTGSLPFRGGINPENITKSLPQYAGAATVTIQSAFRFDYETEEIRKALKYIRTYLRKHEAVAITPEEKKQLSEMCAIFTRCYSETVAAMAPFINEISKLIPSRRERVQHNGLFGYSRGVGKVRLPRAIGFTAVGYSLGIPPEFIGTGRGLKIIKQKGLLPLLEKHFFTLRSELEHAGKFLNFENIERLMNDSSIAGAKEWAREIHDDITLCQEILGIEIGPRRPHHFVHRNYTSNIVLKHQMKSDCSEDVLAAAVLRKSLG